MSDQKIRLQLRPKNQISTQKEDKKILIKKKIKPPIVLVKSTSTDLIDLRNYLDSSQKSKPKVSGKSLIIQCLTQLIDQTENNINLTTGDKRKTDQFRSKQFRKALNSLQSYPFEITSGAQAKTLEGIGQGIADRIDEILKTGKLSELNIEQTIDQQTKIINELTSVTGIGEANAKKFICQGVTSVADLSEKVKSGQIKITHHMQIGLDYYNDFKQKIGFQEILELSEMMKKTISGLYPDLIVEICGSHRRKKLISGDIDVLITNPSIKTEDDLIKSDVGHLKKIVQALIDCGFLVASLTSQGNTKYMGVCKHPKYGIGRRIDLRFVRFESYYPALLYFTGSMMTNKLMRTIALEKGYTLNEYGLYHFYNGEKGEKILVTSEKEIFDLLGIVYLEPSEREIN
jgi:DNA polymerase beta